jgi:hypothetical protein
MTITELLEILVVALFLWYLIADTWAFEEEIDELIEKRKKERKRGIYRPW